MKKTMFKKHRTGEPLDDRPYNLFEPVPKDGGERGRNWNGRVESSSAHTEPRPHPGAAALRR